MPYFRITALDPTTKRERVLVYNSTDSTLTDENGVSLVPDPEHRVVRTIPERMPRGKGDVRVLKIQLGLSCNYSCEYCSQRFVPHAEETHRDEAETFLSGLDDWLRTNPESIEFWGGEPFVYWKTLRPLAEALRDRFPKATFSVITNGSLIDDEKTDWLDRLGFHVAISHDGPGQSVRGPDPLDDPDRRAAILALYRRLAPQKRFSFNAMMNRSNTSRAAVQQFFEALVAPDVEHLSIGEGGIVDAYDEGGVAQSLRAVDEVMAYRNRGFGEIRSGQTTRFASGVGEKIASFVNSFRTRRPLAAVGQKCGMDQRDVVAVDLRGNVLTCQNVSSVSANPAGVSHRIGHVSDLDSVELATGTHWSERSECPSCPMIHICKGACLFLSGPLWETSCDNAYSDAVPIFAASIEFLTGCVPIFIDGDFRDDRKDIFGMVNGVPDAKPKRVIPINAIA